MAPVAVARQPHHLPGRAVDRQRHAAGEAAVGVVADRARRHLDAGAVLRPNSSLAGVLRIVRLFERRQRLRFQRAEVLRGRGPHAGDQQDGSSGPARRRSGIEASCSRTQAGHGRASCDHCGCRHGAPSTPFNADVFTTRAALRQINHQMRRMILRPGSCNASSCLVLALACVGLAGAAGLRRPGQGGHRHRRQQVDPAHGRRGRRPRALRLAGLDRPRRRAAVRHLSGRERLERTWYLAQVRLVADAARDLLPRGLCHPRHRSTCRGSAGRASHGCVRLHPSHAAMLFALVRSHGMGRTRIVVSQFGALCRADPALRSRDRARWRVRGVTR